jgi:FkbM family methyltransferase
MIDRLLQRYARSPNHPGKLRLFGWLYRALAGHRPLDLTVADGLRLQLRPGDHVESCLIFTGWHEEITTRFLRANLQPGQVALVAGANIGYYALQAARAVGASGRVVACEPAPENLAATLRHLAANQLGENVIALCSALGAVPGFLPMEPPPPGNRGSASLRTAAGGVPYQARIDTIEAIVGQFGLGCPDLVQLDVEGYEWAALRGLGPLRPRLLILESDPRDFAGPGSTQADFFAFLQDWGYALFDVTGAPVRGTGFFPENNVVAARTDRPPPHWPKLPPP